MGVWVVDELWTPETETLLVPIIGVTPLILHRFRPELMEGCVLWRPQDLGG
jgi:hypothetical protein